LSIVPCCCWCTSLQHYDQILLHTFSVLLLLWPSQRPCACLTHPYPRKKHMYLVVLELLKHRFQSERDPLAASWWRKIRGEREREREDSRGRCSSSADENLVLGKWGGALWWILGSGGGKILRTSRADWEEQESDDVRSEVSGELICLKQFREAELCWIWLVGDFWDFS
jgi:hypothetical protein